MEKKFQRIIATITAAATMAAVASAFASCGENTAEDKYLYLPYTAQNVVACCRSCF